MKNILAIIVIYNFPTGILNKLIKSIQANGIVRKDILIEDNSKNNRGYGRAINNAVKKNLMKYDYFLILNPDTLLKRNCIKELLKKINEDKDVGIVGPKILNKNGKIWSMGGILDKRRYSGGLIDYGRDNKQSNNASKSIDFVSGTAMFIKREVFKKIGFFSEKYFLYYEDVDFCMRAKESGYLLAVAQKATIIHDASSTIGKNSPMQQYYMARNHLLFLFKFAPSLIKLRELIRMPKTLKEALGKKFELLGIVDFFFRKEGKSDYWG